MLQDCEGRWFAIQVRPNAECAALAGLQSKGYETYLPTYYCTRQWSDRVKKLRLPLFTGYVFCKFSSAATAPMVTTLGVVRVLGIGGTPVPMDDSEIASLQTISSYRFHCCVVLSPSKCKRIGFLLWKLAPSLVRFQRRQHILPGENELKLHIVRIS
jgi:hypothetical protein